MNRSLLVVCIFLLLLCLSIFFNPLQLQTKESLAYLEKISERLDKSDEFIKELKAEKDKIEATKLEKIRVEKAKAQAEQEQQKIEEAKRLEAEIEAKKVADKMLIEAMKAELDSLKAELAVLKKKPIEVAELKKKPIEVVPRQPPNPKTSSLRLENETDQLANIKVNDMFIEVPAKQIKFVTVPAGQFTYQVLGVHEKAILSELNEGQVYGLAIRNAPKMTKDDTKVKEEELPPKPKLDEISKGNTTLGMGNVRLINKNDVMASFVVNGKAYNVESGQEILVKVPVGHCTVGFSTTQVWSYDIAEGATLMLDSFTQAQDFQSQGCSFIQARQGFQSQRFHLGCFSWRKRVSRRQLYHGSTQYGS